MRFARTIHVLAAAFLVAAPLNAQMPEGYRDLIVRKQESERRLLLAMADSMPENLYRERATPAQRDFAQQLHHAAAPVALLGAQLMGKAPPARPDTAAVLNTRAGMRDFINTVYDWAAAAVRAQTDEELLEEAELFGVRVPRWQWWDQLHMHTIWTAGQVVANFRKHGMAPPAFGFF